MGGGFKISVNFQPWGNDAIWRAYFPSGLDTLVDEYLVGETNLVDEVGGFIIFLYFQLDFWPWVKSTSN